MRHAFKKEKRTVTPADEPPLSNGSAAIGIASGAYVKEHSLQASAKIIGWGDAEKTPLKLTAAPALAILKAIKHIGVEQEGVDAFEIPEAFGNRGVSKHEAAEH